MSWLKKAGKNLSSGAKQFGGHLSTAGKQLGGTLAKAAKSDVGRLVIGGAIGGPLGAAALYAGKKGGMLDPKTWGSSGGGAAQPAGPDPNMPKIGEYQAAYGGGTYTAPTATALSGPQNFQGIEAMRSVAKDNPWVNLAKTRQGLEEQTSLQQAGKLAGQAARQAQSNLAMRGGLRSGASERMARQGAMEQALAQQNVRNQGALTRAGFDVEGERMRQGMLGQLAGAEQGYAGYQTGAQQWNELQAAEADKWGREQQIAEGVRKGDYDKYKFGEEAKMYGAGKTADAIARSGGTNSSIWNQLNPFAKA